MTFKQRLFAKIKIDPTDPNGCWLWMAATNSKGYGQIWDGTFTPAGNRRMAKAYRAVYEIYRGPIPAGKQLDHTCHVRRCVNPEHLRPVTSKQNHENRAGARRGSRSGVRGVSWNSRRGKWRVAVGHNGRNHHGGYFDDLDDAAEAARALRNRLYTHNDADREDAA